MSDDVKEREFEELEEGFLCPFLGTPCTPACKFFSDIEDECLIKVYMFNVQDLLEEIKTKP